MKVDRVIPCVCSPNWEDEHIVNGYYGMPQLKLYGGGNVFEAYCPRCGRGALFQYKSAYLALKAWNKLQERLHKIDIWEDADD